MTRRWGIALGITVMALACTDGFFFEPPTGQAGLAVAFDVSAPSLTSSSTLASAFDKADQARIRLSRSTGTTVVDTIVPFSPSSPAVELSLGIDVPNEGETFGILGELLVSSVVVFSGETTVELSPDRSSTAEIPIAPMSVGIIGPPSVTFDALFDTMEVAVYGLFSTGDSIPDIEVQWTVFDTEVVTQTPTGSLVSTGEGSTQVIAQSGVHADTIDVIVDAVVDTVEVQPDPVNADVEQQIQFTATPRDRNGNPLEREASWSVDDESVAFIDSDGLLETFEEGTATVSAEVDGVVGTASLTVTRVVPLVATVTVEPDPAEVWLGGTTQLQAIPKDASGTVLTGRVVEWSSSNPSVAPVSGTGLVSGAALGDATITATVEGVSGTASATVVPVPVGSVTLSPTAATVLVGSQQQITATVRDANGNVVTDRPVTWESNATAVASVDSDGLVIAMSPGSATITATSELKSATAVITVPETTAMAGGTFHVYDAESPLVGTALLYDPTNPLDPGSPVQSVSITGPDGWHFGETLDCQPYFIDEDGLASDRALCLEFVDAVTGSYTGTTPLGETTFNVDASSTLSFPVIDDVLTSGLGIVEVQWSGDSSHGSYAVEIVDSNAAEVIAVAFVPGDEDSVVFDLSLDANGEYKAFVVAFSVDLTVEGAPFPSQLLAAEGDYYPFSPAPPSSFWVSGYDDASLARILQPTNVQSGGDSDYGAIHLAGVAIYADELRVFVADAGDADGTVDVFNTFDGQYVRSIFTGPNTEHLALDVDSHTLYATSSDGYVYVVDALFEELVDGIELGVDQGGLALTPDGSELYVSKADGEVAVISTSTLEITGNITVGSAPRGVAIHGDRAYVANSGSNSVTVINTTNAQVVTTVTVGTGPEDVAVSPCGCFAYVVNRTAGSVSVLDLIDNSVLGTIQVGSLPQSVAFAPEDELAYVTNYGSNTVSVISTITDEVIDTISLPGAGPWGVAVMPPPGPNF